MDPLLPKEPTEAKLEKARGDTRANRTICIHNLTEGEAEAIIAYVTRLIPNVDHKRMSPFELFQQDFMQPKISPISTYGKRRQGGDGAGANSSSSEEPPGIQRTHSTAFPTASDQHQC